MRLDDASARVDEVGEVGAATGDQSSGPLVTLVALLAVVAALWFGLSLLSPEQDQPVDGTEGTAQTTVPVDGDELVAVDEDQVAVDDDAQESEVRIVRLEEPLSAIPVDVPLPLNRIIETTDGFLGIPMAEPGQQVVFLESTDALMWTVVDATDPDRFDEVAALFVASIAVSTDGIDWVVESGSWSPASPITPLRLGGAAFVSGGGGQDWSIVILDPATDREGVFAVPFDTDEVAAATLLDVIVLGETREFADRSPHLLVDVRGQLWSLNTTWGEWTLLFDPADLDADRADDAGTPIDTADGPFTLSTDGNRVYQPIADGLRMIELGEDDDGVLEGVVRSAQLGPPEWFSSVTTVESSTILLANNERVLFHDGDRRLWLVEPPALD